MSRPIGAASVALFAGSGLLTIPGGLLWTGLYGVPHHGRLGLGMLIAGLVLATIFVALHDD